MRAAIATSYFAPGSAFVSGATVITVACPGDCRTPEKRGVRVLCGDTECFTGRATMAGARDLPATGESASTDWRALADRSKIELAFKVKADESICAS